MEHINLMRSFFSGLERSSASKEIAVSFANYFRENAHAAPMAWNTKDYSFLYNFLGNLSSATIVTPDQSLDDITKKLLMISDFAVVTHRNGIRHQIANEYLIGRPETVYPDDDITYFLRCNDINELGNWLKSCRNALEKGRLFYVPDIFISQERISAYGSRDLIEHEPLRDFTANLISSSKQLVQTENITSNNSAILRGQNVKQFIIRRILEAEIPYIEDVNLETFTKIAEEEDDAFSAFKNHIQLKLVDLHKNEGSNFYEADLYKISLELGEGIRKLNSDFDRLNQKTYFQSIGASIASVTVVLVAVNVEAFSILPELLGTGGGLLALSTVFADYITTKSDLTSSPYYYLWLVSRKAKRRKKR